MYRLGILSSGRGTNFEAIEAKVAGGSIPETSIAVVLSDNEKAAVLETAHKKNIPAYWLAAKDNQNRNEIILSYFDDCSVDLGICAGYFRILGGELLKQYEGRILNIHPAPLPDYGGKGMFGDNVYKEMLERGGQYGGQLCTS